MTKMKTKLFVFFGQHKGQLDFEVLSEGNFQTFCCINSGLNSCCSTQEGLIPVPSWGGLYGHDMEFLQQGDLSIPLNRSWRPWNSLNSRRKMVNNSHRASRDNRSQAENSSYCALRDTIFFSPLNCLLGSDDLVWWQIGSVFFVVFEVNGQLSEDHGISLPADHSRLESEAHDQAMARRLGRLGAKMMKKIRKTGAIEGSVVSCC